MAQSEESASVVLSKISRTHLECGICHERYQVPKFLECLHSFCEHCLTTYKNTVAEVSAMMPCPVCRKKTKLPLDGVAGLKTNFHLMGMVEDFTLQEKLTRQKGLKVPCDLCQHRQEADSRCMDCPFFLCVNCRLVHLRIEATTNHEVLALDTLRSGIMSLRPKVKDGPPCQKHRGEKKRFFCETCQVLICRDCTVVEHREAEHKFTTIDDAASRFREATQKLIDNVEESWRAHKETKDALKQMASDLHRSASLSYQQVIDRGTKEESKIADYEANILKDINQRENLRKVTFRTNGIRFFQPSKSKSAESLRTGKEIKQEYSKSLKEKFVKIDKALDELSLNIETLLKTDGDIHSLIEISKEEALKKGSDDRSEVVAARDKLLLQARSTINLRQQTIRELSKMTEGQILRLRHALDTAGDVVKSAYNVDFLNLYSVIDSDLEDLLGESPPNLHPGYPMIEFKSSDGTGLGEVVVGATWRWKYDVSIPTGSLYYVGTESAIKNITIASNKAVVEGRSGVWVLDITNRSWGEAVNQSGERVATLPDDSIVHMTASNVSLFDPNFSRGSTFDLSRTIKIDESDTELGRPVSITYYKDQLLAIGYTNWQGVLVHDSSTGKVIRQIPVGIKPEFLTSTSRSRILVAARTPAVIEGLDSRGGTALTIHPVIEGVHEGKQVSCVGICRDSRDTIYVALLPDDVSKVHVHQYSPYGNFLGCSVFDISPPVCGIAVTGNDCLVLAEQYGCKVYERHSEHC